MKDFITPISLIALSLSLFAFDNPIDEDYDDELVSEEWIEMQDSGIASKVAFEDLAMNEEENNSNQPSSELKIFHYRPHIDAHNFYVNADFLYWKVEEGELDYILTDVETGAGVTTSSGATGHLKEARFDCKAGLRIAAGATFSPDFWIVEGRYTWIHPKGSSSTNSSDLPLQGTYQTNNTTAIQSATSHINLNYQVADLILAKRFMLSKQVLVRAFTGVIGAWLNQHWTIKYFGGAPNQEIKQNWSFSGGGLQLGINGDWFIGSGISLVGECRGALIYGNYQNQLNNREEPSSLTIEDPRLHDHRVIPTLQLSFGPAWGKMFKGWGINLFAGYELNAWYNLQLINRSLPITSCSICGRNSVHSNGVLALQGLTMRLEVDF
jgi:hypothetical protein